MLFYQHPSKKLRNIISESRCLGDLVTWCLNLGVRFAPGFPLYLCSLHFSSLKNVCCPLSVVCCPKMLAKDAASIPNATGYEQ